MVSEAAAHGGVQALGLTHAWSGTMTSGSAGLTWHHLSSGRSSLASSGRDEVWDADHSGSRVERAERKDSGETPDGQGSSRAGSQRLHSVVLRLLHEHAMPNVSHRHPRPPQFFRSSRVTSSSRRSTQCTTGGCLHCPEQNSGSAAPAIAATLLSAVPVLAQVRDWA